MKRFSPYSHRLAILLILFGGGLFVLFAGRVVTIAASPVVPLNSVTAIPSGTTTPSTPTITRTATIPRTATITRTPTNTRTPTQTRTPTPTPGCNDWRQSPSLSGGELVNTFYGVAAAETGDVWAVGNRGDYGSVNLRVLIERWDGAEWATMPVTNTGSLRGVAVVAPDDVWAVGYSADDVAQTLTMHWDGTAWSTVPSPNITGTANYLYGVAAAGADDVWAVGEAGEQSLILRWNGTQWAAVPAPVIEYSLLNGVAVAGPNDVWAAGSHGYYNAHMLVLHWDGSAWTQSPAPNVGSWRNSLQSVSVTSANDVWAAGWATDGQSTFSGAILHWDGTQWSVSPTGEAPNTGSVQLFGVASVSPTEAWAVGWAYVGTVRKNVILRWDGTAWTPPNTPSPSSYFNELFGIAAAGPGEAWAVGIYGLDNGGVYDTLALRYGPPCGTVTPTATGTQTTSTGTSTPASTSVATASATGTIVAPTATATATTPVTGTTTVTPTVPVSGTATVTVTIPVTNTATPTAEATGTVPPTAIACNVYYSDVPGSNPFYGQIMCLSCMGMISGYPDATFRPGALVTRGQLAKIVSNTAGFSDTPVQQTFEDVPEGSTFYMYIERMASQGVAGGYACGGAGEPCGPDNRPYFRPGANATRGQISKIVSNAAGLTNPPGERLFEDVAPGSAFFDYVQRLAGRGVMSGYPCGGTGEPCGSGNLPYFRPGANATRGQTSKIVANTFYPDCQMGAQR